MSSPVRIMVVDDSAIDRKLMLQCCKFAFPNAEYLQASDGVDALQQLLQHKAIDIVLTDLKMPRMDGLELLRQLKQKGQEISVVIATAVGSEELAVQALKEGAASYVPKRRLVEDLPATVQQLVEARRFASDPGDVSYFSCFISYSREDEAFCHYLYEVLSQHSIQVWYSPKDIRAGEKLHEQIFGAINRYDKLLLVLSEHSMSSKWVASEILHARKREEETGHRVLFPIRLVPMETLQQWQLFDGDTGADLAKEIREYFIPDFSTADPVAMARLITDLEVHR